MIFNNETTTNVTSTTTISPIQTTDDDNNDDSTCACNNDSVMKVALLIKIGIVIVDVLSVFCVIYACSIVFHNARVS